MATSTKQIILRPGKFNDDDLKHVREKNKIWQVIDIYEQQLEELYTVCHPDKAVSFEDYGKQKMHGDLAGAWVYYPWSGILLHCLDDIDLQKLRTNRNQNLITQQEQQQLSNSCVGVAGMSVGSGIALACVYSGMSNSIKLADFDALSTTNLNRLRESLSNVGQPKLELAARTIFELNPFANVEQVQGITQENIDNFFDDPKLNVVVDEIDDFKMKVKLRLKAKSAQIPLLMFTSLGDNILVDVERYDIEPTLPIFNGAIGDEAEEILRKEQLSDADMKRYAVSIVGPEYVPTRALDSLMHIGSSLVGRPQLYSTIAVDGGLAAYLIRCIILNAPLKSGRYFIKFAELFEIMSDDLTESSERNSLLQKLMRG